MTLAEELAREYGEKLLAEGYPLYQVAELLGQQGALWGNDLPAAQQAYQAEARRLLSRYVDCGTLKVKGAK